ncbi:uncharacterized protein LOC126335888 isoform X1 [Schistocerca gregaria]|uniref:uncharacterized protein LOC126335888 isoform X1 n=1 Tax=Schistocerca gregaria TaxID=7010 RepID=UPI00211F2EB9|nr:uncharacterized protein LOC126335888 isoform X1 [Schistocerca gregaria]
MHFSVNWRGKFATFPVKNCKVPHLGGWGHACSRCERQKVKSDQCIVMVQKKRIMSRVAGTKYEDHKAMKNKNMHHCSISLCHLSIPIRCRVHITIQACDFTKKQLILIMSHGSMNTDISRYSRKISLQWSKLHHISH